MTKALLLLLAVSLHGVAGEVGAPNPQPAQTASDTLASVTTGDTGASANLAAQPYNIMANDQELQNFEVQAAKLDAIVNESLSAVISNKVGDLLEGRSNRLYISGTQF